LHFLTSYIITEKELEKRKSTKIISDNIYSYPFATSPP
jgi:hypothetical protein